MQDSKSTASARQLSPLRNTTAASEIDALVAEQLRHFSIDPEGAYGEALARLTRNLYQANVAANDLWLATIDTHRRSRPQGPRRLFQRQALRLLPARQDPRHAAEPAAQDLPVAGGQDRARGRPRARTRSSTTSRPSSAPRPVITRTATYLYACVEWVEDAFKGKELLHEIYSRLLNPTSVSLANHIVDVEAGPLRRASISPGTSTPAWPRSMRRSSHLVGYQDIVLASRNVYGGSYQLLHDWYGKRSNLDVAVRLVRRLHGAADFEAALAGAREAPSRPARRRAPHLRLPREARAIRTATCSTCPASAAARTERARR